MATWRGVILRVSLSACLALVSATSARGADVYVAAGANLQTAIDNAQPGDRLLLAPGATFTGNFVLTDKGASTAYITIRSAAADLLLPPDGVRILPSDAPNLPVIKSADTFPAMTAAAGAHHWCLQLLEFQGNVRGYGDVIALGAGDTTQTSLAQVPHDLVLDRLYIHGDSNIGQKRGISLQSGATWVLNCFIADMKGVGMDTQAISGYNGPGPYTIRNNYLEAAGENFLLGGASPKIPNVIPSDVEFSGNHLTKPLAWRLPILAAPTGVTATAGGSGSLPAATYSYRVVAVRRTALDVWAFSDRSNEVTAGAAAGGRVTVAWTPVAGTTVYRVYRGSAPGAQDRYFESWSASFVDDGTAAAVADSGASIRGTRWTVKNIFELKLGQRVRVRGNLLENCWKESQAGFAVLFTPRNQDGTSSWIYVRDVEFSGNIVRHAGSGVQIEGYDTNATSQQTRRISLVNNVFDDISSTGWGGSGRWIQIGNGPSDITVDHNTVVHDGQVIYAYGGTYGAETQVPNLRFTNNLLKHNAYGIMGDGRAYGFDAINAYFPGAIMTRNTFAGGTASRYPAGNEFPTVSYWQGQFVNFAASNFGLIAASPYRGTGTDALDLGAPFAQVESDAAAARAGRSGPPPAVTITSTTVPDGRTGAPYAFTLTAIGGTGTYVWSITAGALPAGVSLAAATGALSGTPTQSGVFSMTVAARDAGDATNAASQAYALTIDSIPPAVAITSPAQGARIIGTALSLGAAASDTDGSVARVDYYANNTFVGRTAASPWTFQWQGVAPGTYQLTAVATDDTALSTTSAAIDITVLAPVTVDTLSLGAGRTGSLYSTSLAASGGSGTYVWAVSTGQLPSGLSLGATGLLSGTPTLAGSFAFTVRAQDANDASNVGTSSYVLSVASTGPQVAITSPITGAAITGTSVSIAATASDTDGSVACVDFYAGAVLVGRATAAPWVTAWTNAAPGTYLLTAVATDNGGLTATSAAVTVAVSANITAVALPGTVQVENFDAGGEGVGYHDSTAGNTGGAYRTTDVDIEPTKDTGGGYNVGWMVAGEWLKYTVTVAKAGTYTVGVRVAVNGAGGTFHVEFGGSDRTGPLTVPNTGGWQTWVTVRKTIMLAAGTQVMRLVLDANSATGIFGNVNYVSVTALPDVVFYATDLTLHGSWTRQASATAAGGIKAVTPDRGWSTVAAPLASPADYVERTFNAPAASYALWLRLRATGDWKYSDSVWVQFSDARSGWGASIYPIGSTSALVVNLESCTGCGLSKWGWQNGASWATQPKTITFATSGPHTIRIQVREDGVQIDQVVLSPVRYLTTAPGLVKNDATIVSKP